MCGSQEGPNHKDLLYAILMQKINAYYYFIIDIHLYLDDEIIFLTPLELIKDIVKTKCILIVQINFYLPMKA